MSGRHGGLDGGICIQSLLLLTIYLVKPVVLGRLVEYRLATPVISVVMKMKRV